MTPASNQFCKNSGIATSCMVVINCTLSIIINTITARKAYSSSKDIHIMFIHDVNSIRYF